MLTFFQTEAKENEPVPLCLSFLGEHYEQEPIERPSGTQDLQIFFSEKGSGELILSGEHMKVREGECFLLHPGTACSYRAAEEKWIISNAGLTGSICSALFSALGLSRSGVYQISNPQIFTKNLRILKHLTEKTQNQRDWSAACYQFALDLGKSLRFRSAEQFVQGVYSETSYAGRVIRCLEENLTEPLYIPALAEKLGVNHQYLCTVFRKETGLTIVTYLHRLRIGNARMMLERFPERTASEIGKAVGYDSPSYFGAQFKKITGLTPDQYRKKGSAVVQK